MVNRHHTKHMKRRLRAIRDRWEKDAEALAEMGFRYGDGPDGNEGPFGETLRNIDTARAELEAAIAMAPESFSQELAKGRDLNSTETADALFGAPTYEMCGGCGATEPSQRCIGCLHDFGHGSSDWVHKVYK